MKWHINPETGIAGKCKATLKCPFGDLKTEHFPSETKAYEHFSAKVEEVLSEAKEFYGGNFVSLYSMEIEPGILQTINLLGTVGNPLVVGGAVRDSFQGLTPKDIDVEVHGTDVDSIIALLKNKGFTVDEVGKAFGVLKVSKKGVVSDLDVSVPRRENRVGAGHRDFEVEVDGKMTVSEAAERRDFTLNAMMFDPRRGVLVDPANGKQDMENKVLRHVSEKFSEDPLRVLRGFQLASRLGAKFDPSTAKLCKNLRAEYDSLPDERVKEEWAKFFSKAAYPEMGIAALKDSGWDDTIPGLKEALDAKTVDKLKNLSTVPKERRIPIGAAIISSSIKNRSHKNDFLSSVVVGMNQQNLAESLERVNPGDIDTPSKRKEYIFDNKRTGFNYDVYSDYCRATGNKKSLEYAQSAKNEGIFENPEATIVGGNEFLEATGKKPGPWLGKVLSAVRHKQYETGFSTKEEAVLYGMKFVDQD